MDREVLHPGRDDKEGGNPSVGAGHCLFGQVVQLQRADPRAAGEGRGGTAQIVRDRKRGEGRADLETLAADSGHCEYHKTVRVRLHVPRGSPHR